MTRGNAAHLLRERSRQREIHPVTYGEIDALAREAKRAALESFAAIVIVVALAAFALAYLAGGAS